MSDRDRDELALAIAHPKRSPTGMVTEPMPDECDRCVDALLAADKLIAAGWRRSTVTPEQVDAAAKDLSGLVNRVQLWDKFEEDDRRYWRAKVQIVARWFGLSVAEDGAS